MYRHGKVHGPAMSRTRCSELECLSHAWGWRWARCWAKPSFVEEWGKVERNRGDAQDDQ